MFFILSHYTKNVKIFSPVDGSHAVKKTLGLAPYFIWSDALADAPLWRPPWPSNLAGKPRFIGSCQRRFPASLCITLCRRCSEGHFVFELVSFSLRVIPWTDGSGIMLPTDWTLHVFAVHRRSCQPRHDAPCWFAPHQNFLSFRSSSSTSAD